MNEEDDIIIDESLSKHLQQRDIEEEKEKVDDKIIFLISHRMASVHIADEIWFMKKKK